MKYSFLDESYDTVAEATNRLSDNYFPETSGDQYEDDRWYAYRSIENLQPGETIYVNGFAVTREM